MNSSEVSISNVYCNLTGDRVDFSLFVDGTRIDEYASVDPVWGKTPKGNSTVTGLSVSACDQQIELDAQMVRKLKLQHLTTAFKRASQLVNQDEDRREMDPDSYMEMQDFDGLAEYIVSAL